MFGMVLQDTWLFNGTIMENIRYGRPEATDAEVIAAAKAARVHHFVRTLPDGYNMVLNEESSNISQGQMQLLTIARAILADPQMLILDEATPVDTHTEVLIQRPWTPDEGPHHRHRHRLSTIATPTSSSSWTRRHRRAGLARRSAGQRRRLRRSCTTASSTAPGRLSTGQTQPVPRNRSAMKGIGLVKDYHINLLYGDEDGGYIADMPDLCVALRPAREETLREVLRAKEAGRGSAQQRQTDSSATLPAGNLPGDIGRP